MRSFWTFAALVVGIVLASLAAVYPYQAQRALGLPGPQQSLAVMAPAPAGTLSLVTEPQDGVAPVLALIERAKKSVDLVMYQLTDEQVMQTLCAAHGRGVTVRVLLNQGYYGKETGDYGKPEPYNQPAYDYLESCGVPVRWTPAYFALTHQKTLVIDTEEALIMTFNLVPRYYATARDFGILDSDPADVSAIEAAFDDDWRGRQRDAPPGDSLLWSPGSEQVLLALIAGARSTLDIYCELMADRDIIEGLKAAAGRGVAVRVNMTYSTNWKAALGELAAAGVSVRTYPSTSKKLYIHAKVLLVDGARAFVGSENFSENSLNANRELGLVLSDRAILSELSTIFEVDWAGSRSFAAPSAAAAELKNIFASPATVGYSFRTALSSNG